ncbi:Nucleotide-binding universal stress protein, UspA family [Lentibacillus persicus]|uniref:Nucleotide-binding universal stress protein, UspA family n=1 Tax=Lentibacillus persicus TaxID=640948 RepID=A0A1I1X849_9BACI|nr:universal stress protein [Lentibacillus persicus]SFE01873.1 Nucleotide-binding universal stress protein, UspA family [Lentibacillus persicus]
MKRKILVAYDGSALSKEALQEARLQAAGVPETEVHVVSVVSQAGPTTNIAIARNIQWELAEQIRSEMEEIKKDFEADDVTIKTDVIIEEIHRNEGTKLCEYAEEHDIDLIIVGSRGLGGVKKIFLGSVSNRIVQEAGCPVLVIK